ncbi:MAG TPA: DNA repair protein RecN [Prevotellaceae bacterium]|nr:DNA repair protein RecN [Prevotellaceae bacterium]
MLTHLSIRNYVLIKELDIDWPDGFTVITGETGAGKSILLGAIGLLTGQRADTKSILPGAAKCTIEGTFRRQDDELRNFLTQHELDCDDGECIIRRELTTGGKSRCFVNDTPVTAGDLRALAHLLVDIHSQHQNLLLGKEDFQLAVLDTVAQDQATASKYRSCFRAYRDALRELDEAREQTKTAKAEEDYLSYQLGQIEELHLKEHEEEALQKEQQTLTHAEEIRSSLYQATQVLDAGDTETSVLDGLKTASQILRTTARLYPPLDPYTERIESAIIELKDIGADLDNMGERIDSNPARLDEVTRRLDRIYTLEQKHNARSGDELVGIAESLRKRLDEISHGDERVSQLEKQVKELYDEAARLASTLTRQRQKAARTVEASVAKSLGMLEMPDSSFSIQMENLQALAERGADRVTFLFSANKNMPTRPITEAASGGETARLMLALKALMAQQASLPTIVFDEIDTGVSGRVADAMARLMRQMGDNNGQQVIAITHLPQIAAQGDAHFFVYKDSGKEQTTSHMRRLTDEERVTEVAHMLSGTTLTQAAMDNARQLLAK